MVLVGEHDNAISKAVVDATLSNYLKNCKVEVIKNSGHYPMNETPVYLASTMENFLKE